MTLNVQREFDNPERERLERFSDKLFDMSYDILSELDCEAYLSDEPLKFGERFDGRKITVHIGDKWAVNNFDCAWYHVTGKKPENADTLILDCGGEGLVYDVFGNPIKAITCTAADFDSDLGMPVKRIIPLTDDLIVDGIIELWIDCGANDLFGNMINDSKTMFLNTAKKNTEIRALAYDYQVLLTVLDFGEDEEFKSQIKSAVTDISYMDITEETAADIRKSLTRLMSQKSEENFTYYAVGHAHLDLAWRWPLRESFRKGGRTFSTQIKNIEKYPDYIFGASQAQLYSWVKNLYPSIYTKVKELVKQGRWDVQGATWVEPDSNLIGGESLIRQFFYGKKYFMDEFGLEMKIFWVPDSFGYSACIPQVMKLADVPYFLTQKMSWNTFNKFPYHSFYWKGLDGTEVLSHMLPENTYNSPVRGDYLKMGEKNYAERKISDKSMMLFGIGDGGAGPGYEHIERAERYKNLRAMPKVKMCKSMDFFKDFDDGKTPYPTWQGELYLERHQGTYTTRSDNKRYNRKCEFALRNYEMLTAKAADAGIEVPISHEEIETIWKEILLYQFHDILPGSSIDRVYDESTKRYAVILNRLTNASEYLLCKIHKTKTAVNLNSFSFNTKLKCGKDWYDITVPALGSASVCKEDKITEFKASCTYNTIENDKIKVTFEDGFIVSLFDKELKKEFITDGKKAGVISEYDDFGDSWDMTGVQAEYIQTKRDSSCVLFKTRTDGAKAYAQCKYKTDGSEISQYYYVLDGDSTLYCKLDLDVKQKNIMLRMAIPVNIETDECAFNIQFGHIMRKTTENTPQELAQYEVSGQKFADMSDDKCGISFINDCKYGYRCKYGVIDINLVRTPTGGPGKLVDLGHHTINWALAPHKGKLGAETYKKAYLLNNPLIVINGDLGEKKTESAYSSTNENIILETIKIPEDKNGIIARFYNCSDKEQTADISIDGYKMWEIVNIPEKKVEDKTDGKITLHGFGLVNIRFVK